MFGITVKTIPAVRLAITYRMLSSSIPKTIKKSKMPPRPKFTDDMERDIEEKFLHGGRGPGGQKINKCNSKVQLRHVPTGIVVDCQATRSRDQNRKIAREKLALRLAQWENGDQPIERELAKIQWEQQSKRSKERKAKSKHREAQEQRQQQKLQQTIEEKQLLKSLLEQ
ncbi:hypothetical protein KDRO_C06580 [Kluyveromyces lactis]|nr:hypothetical protein KDRO_C06580 [Kluyveromyces lactis]